MVLGVGNGLPRDGDYKESQPAPFQGSTLGGTQVPCRNRRQTGFEYSIVSATLTSSVTLFLSGSSLARAS